MRALDLHLALEEGIPLEMVLKNLADDAETEATRRGELAKGYSNRTRHYRELMSAKTRLRGHAAGLREAIDIVKIAEGWRRHQDAREVQT